MWNEIKYLDFKFIFAKDHSGLDVASSFIKHMFISIRSIYYRYEEPTYKLMLNFFPLLIQVGKSAIILVSISAICYYIISKTFKYCYLVSLLYSNHLVPSMKNKKIKNNEFAFSIKSQLRDRWKCCRSVLEVYCITNPNIWVAQSNRWWFWSHVSLSTASRSSTSLNDENICYGST